jgi:hypothetical protein
MYEIRKAIDLPIVCSFAFSQVAASGTSSSNMPAQMQHPCFSQPPPAMHKHIQRCLDHALMMMMKKKGLWRNAHLIVLAAAILW